MKEHTRITSKVKDIFASMGFARPTQIQYMATPQILQKKDSVIVAPTGSGKTECAVIPVFHSISHDRAPGHIRCLYITPLRALNRDIFRRITQYAENNNLEIKVRHGDTTARERQQIAKSPPDILITTPETAVVLLSQPKMLSALSKLKWVIIDEVHEIVPNKRGSQLSITLERLQKNTTYPLTRIGLSATLGNTKQAAKFVAGTHRRCRIVRDRTLREYNVEIVLAEGEITNVSDAIVAHITKCNIKSPVLLFTNTRGEAELLAATLRERTAIPVDMHHGSLSKQVRQDTEEVLRKGGERMVVCTSSLELGLDIGDVELVIHYGSPRQVSKLVQRIGRSRHHGHRSAHGLIVANHQDDMYEARAIIKRVQEGSIESQRVHCAPLDVMAHHMVGLLYQTGGPLTLQQVLSTVTEAYPYRLITEKDLYDVLDVLDARRIVVFDRDSATYTLGRRAFMYHLENLTTIPDILKFRVFDTAAKRPIGSLDQRFVGDNGEAGSVFILRGSQWRIVDVDEKALQVNVEPARSQDIAIPYWEGESLSVDMETAAIVGTMEERRSLGPPAQIQAVSIIIEATRSKGLVVIHSCMGTRINATLAALLSSIISAARGSVVRSRSDAYRIALTSPGRITQAAVYEALQDQYDLREVVIASVAGTHNVNWRVWQACKKFGVLSKDEVYDRKRSRFMYERYKGTPIVQEALRDLFHGKYDIEGTGLVLERIRDGAIPLEWRDMDTLSSLAQPILDHTTKKYQSTQIDPELLGIVYERLQKTKHRLVCARCGKWQRVMETREVKTIQPCPYCKARQVTATFYSDHELPKIISKKYAGQRLSAQESHAYKRAWKVSSLIETFGATALLVLSGYGVGADTGARILRNMVDQKYTLQQIYEAERQYVLTRKFWSQ